jgi:hypothetical protein
MKKLFAGLGMALILMVGMTSCADPEASALLTDGTWKFRNMTTNSEDETIKGLVALGKAILTDATLELNSNGEYIIDSPLLQDPETGSWELIGEDQLILTTDDGAPSTANIETLTKDKLSYIETFIEPESQTTYSVTTTWVK